MKIIGEYIKKLLLNLIAIIFCLIKHICRLKGEILSFALFSAGILIPFVVDNKLTWQTALSLSASFAGVLLGIYNYQLSKQRKRQERLRQLRKLSSRIKDNDGYSNMK